MPYPAGIANAGGLGVAELGAFVLGGWAPGSIDIDDRVLVQMDDGPDGALFRLLVFGFAELWLRKLNVVRKIPHAFDYTTATGKQLDMIGALVGLPRRGFSDSRYRVFLTIQTQLILAASADNDEEWTGNVDNLVKIVRTYLDSGTPGDGSIRLYNVPPYAYLLEITGVPIEEIDLLTYFLCRASYAGVLGSISYSLNATAGKWDSSTAGSTIAGTGVWGSETAGTAISDVLTWGTTVQIGGEGIDC